MKSILVFALVLAVAGGVIAYIGDRLGTYVGKKRISQFGLRPRHTATLYTTLSGGLISVLTLLVLVGLDHTFQRALLEGPQLVYENGHYRQQIKDEQENVKTGQAQAEQALTKAQQAESQLLPVQRQLAGVKAMLRDSRRKLQQRQRQLGDTQAQLLTVRAGLGATDRLLQQQRRQVQQARLAVADAEAGVRAARQKVAQQRFRLSELTEARRRLQTANADLRTANADLQHTNDQLKAKSVRLAERTASSQQSLIFRSEQELGRRVIKAAQPVPLIENDLTAFLEGLGRTAESRGAKEGVGGRAVVVAVPVAPGSSVYRPLTLLEEHGAVETLAQQIAGQSSEIPSVVVVARTVTNSFQGEQATIRLQPYENVLIYPKGTAIAATTINGAGTPFQIVDALAGFLAERVRPEVLRRHLIPQEDPETGQPMIGSVLDEAESQALVQQIQQAGGTVQVTAYAGEDTYSSGPLRLRLGIAPAGPTKAVGIPSSGRS